MGHAAKHKRKMRVCHGDNHHRRAVHGWERDERGQAVEGDRPTNTVAGADAAVAAGAAWVKKALACLTSAGAGLGSRHGEMRVHRGYGVPLLLDEHGNPSRLVQLTHPSLHIYGRHARRQLRFRVRVVGNRIAPAIYYRDGGSYSYTHRM